MVCNLVWGEPMKILLLGQQDKFLAQQIFSHFREVGENIRWLSRFDPVIDDLKAIIESALPTVIINTLEESDIRWCEEHRDKAFMANSATVMRLACICYNHGIILVHLSSGDIFRGNAQTGFLTELSEPHPDSWYAKTKLYAEEFIRDVNPDHIIVRICFPISSCPHPGNFLDQCANFSKLSQVETSVTIIDDLVPIIYKLLFSRCLGTYNCVNSGTISPYELRQMLDGANNKYPIDPYWHGVCMYSRELVARGFELPSLFEDNHLAKIIAIWKERKDAYEGYNFSRR